MRLRFHLQLFFIDTAAENAANTIIDKSVAFGFRHSFISDGPTHFRKGTVQMVTKGLEVPPHFTLLYRPWSNRIVETLGNVLLQTFRSVLLEYQIPPEEWLDILSLVLSVLNNSPSLQYDKICPVTSFLGLEPSTPISTFTPSNTPKPILVRKPICERALILTNLNFIIVGAPTSIT